MPGPVDEIVEASGEGGIWALEGARMVTARRARTVRRHLGMVGGRVR